MKKIRNTVAFLSVMMSSTLLASWPENAFTKELSASSLIKNTNSTFALVGKKQKAEQNSFTFMPSSQLNANYITGQTKKEENKVEKLLHWDFKVKFKLNRNMNIIFSYN